MTEAETSQREAATRLARAVGKVAAKNRELIESLKQRAETRHEPLFVWNRLVGSFATMGSSRGAKLMKEKSLRAKVEFAALEELRRDQRRKVIRQTLYAATVRMPDRKTEWLMVNFDRMVAEGGPKAVKAQLEACEGREAKIRFLKTFKGIGDKYARNIMMDVYHSDFRDSIAVDERIKKVTNALGISFDNYREAEQFYLGVAHRAGLNGWELDRLLHNRTNEVLDVLGHPTTA